MPTTVSEVIEFLQNPETHPADLDLIKDILAGRLNEVRTEQHSLPADQVRKGKFNAQSAPSYMPGVECEVHGPAPSGRRSDPKVYIRLAPNAPRRALERFGSGLVRCPLSIIDIED